MDGNTTRGNISAALEGHVDMTQYQTNPLFRSPFNRLAETVLTQKQSWRPYSDSSLFRRLELNRTRLRNRWPAIRITVITGPTPSLGFGD
jgi:hypothetical protein